MKTPPPVRLFATDLDGTLLGDAAATRRFQSAWESLDSAQRPLLAYHTARSVSDTRWRLLDGDLPAAEFIIGGLGTEVHDPIDPHVAEEFAMSIASGWDRVKIDSIVSGTPGVRPQSPDLQGAYRSSWHWNLASTGQLAELAAQFARAGLEVTVNYSADVCLDILPRRAGKGNALAWLCRRVGVSLENVLVAGTNGTNLSMFALPAVRGILPGNTSRELLTGTAAFKPFLSGASYADGVMLGLAHYGVLPIGSPESDSARTALPGLV